MWTENDIANMNKTDDNLQVQFVSPDVTRWNATPYGVISTKYQNDLSCHSFHDLGNIFSVLLTQIGNCTHHVP